MKTRGQKRRRGERDVWDLIVNNDDVSFQHILPRLNATDIKFLYGVNTKTRKMIKRSSRAGDLKKTFYIEKMSSISTLDVVWENLSSCERESWLDETYFCYLVAETNKLELLKWIREEKECEWDSATIIVAASEGNLEMVKYCVANECPIDELACAWAADGGHLEILKYLREEVKAPWDYWTAAWAARNGHLHILEYLADRKFAFNTTACIAAAKHGHLDCLKYLHETAKAPWNEFAVSNAHYNGYPECVQYLLDNDCTLPAGWSYEGGVLHALPDEYEDEKKSFFDDDYSSSLSSSSS